MNKSVFTLKTLLALLVVIVMALTMVSCDQLPFDIDGIFGGETPDDGGDETPEHTHQYETVVNQEATCTKKGSATCTCACGDSYELTLLPKGHTYVDGFCDCGSMDPDYVPEIHTHAYVDGKCECGALDPDYVAPHEHVYVDGKCECGATDPNYIPPVHEHVFVDGKCECGAEVEVTPEIKTITIAEAITLCGQYPDGTPEQYYIRATVQTISNATYGEMIIEDSTGELYVYGTRGEDGVTYFDKLPERPVKGDEVLLLCTLSQFKGENQVKLACLIEFTHTEVSPDDIANYTEMTIADARKAEAGALVRIKGVVAQITYANGYVPAGAIIVDGTSSIYVYSSDLAGQVSVGNTVDIAATKAYWILEKEQTNAEKFGYKGSNQLESVIVVSNDKATSDFDKSWISETTVKEIMDTPVTEDITNKIFKVTALVKKVDGTGFINYYLNDIDGYTGSYVYTQCNGGDFAWLDEFDGKFCTVYIVAMNAKSSATGCLWRFLPVAVSDDGYTFNTDNAGEYAVKYHALGQFIDVYNADPTLELLTSVSSELLGFEGATLSYVSSNEAVVYFTVEDGKTIMHCKENGTATITITGTYDDKSYSATVDIQVLDPEQIEYITVADAIVAEVDSTVTVRGIVGPSVVNKNGFYLFGEDGSVIAVLVNDLTQFAGLEIGHEVILTGMRERYVKDDASTIAGQTCIVNAEIVANLFGNHEYSTEKFITDKTLADIKALDITESHSTEVYVVKAVVEVVETAYYTNLKITYNGTELALYCSGASQYNWLKEYAGQEITMEIAPCNWNDKKDNYRGCVLAVVLEDGKVYNTLNFDNN